MKAIMYTTAAMFTLLPLAMGASPDEEADRAKLLGSWVEQNGRGSAWTINNITTGLHVTQMEGNVAVADFDCNVEGRDCNVKISGHKATVSMYYNGPALVELETKGDKVVKRRFSISPAGNSMKMELIPITGHDEPAEFQFERGQPAEGKK